MKYSYSARVRFSEIGTNGKLTLPSMINYLQDCATFHGEAGHVGILKALALGQTWVLTSLRLRIHHYPAYAENIIASTWAVGFRGCIGYREFSVEDESGQACALGKSEWIFMDHGKPADVPEDQIHGYGIEKNLELEGDFGKRKIRLPRDGGLLKESFRITEIHLDANGHMNNSQYIRLAQNYLPEDFAAGSLRAEYKKQAFSGDELTPVIYHTAGGYLTAFLSTDGNPCFTAEFLA